MRRVLIDRVSPTSLKVIVKFLVLDDMHGPSPIQQQSISRIHAVVIFQQPAEHLDDVNLHLPRLFESGEAPSLEALDDVVHVDWVVD